MTDRVYLSSHEFGTSFIDITDGGYDAATAYFPGFTLHLTQDDAIDVRLGRWFDEDAAIKAANESLSAHVRTELAYAQQELEGA